MADTPTSFDGVFNGSSVFNFAEEILFCCPIWGQEVVETVIRSEKKSVGASGQEKSITAIAKQSQHQRHPVANAFGLGFGQVAGEHGAFLGVRFQKKLGFGVKTRIATAIEGTHPAGPPPRSTIVS